MTTMTALPETVAGNGRPTEQLDVGAPRRDERLVYLDNLKVALTALVIIFHVAICYGAVGSWYYLEHRDAPVTNALLTWFVATLQFFFMGLFFLMAGYFTPASAERKGLARFLVDRLKRLGIPLLIFAVTISPFLEATKAATGDSAVPFWNAWRRSLLQFAPGPLWFVETLLVFAIGYALWRALRPGEPRSTLVAPPVGNRGLVLVAVALASTSFLTRLWYPIGQEWHHLQLAFYPQYIAMFVVGIVGYERGWLASLDDRLARIWGPVVALAILAIPILIVVSGALDGNGDLLAGGVHWQAAATALLEAVIAVGMAVTLIVVFRRRVRRQGGLQRQLTRSAYAAYVLQAPIVVGLTYALHGVALPPALKFALVAPVAVGLTFALSTLLVRKIRVVGAVL